jgi:fibro-slime domain-containing protein
MRTARFWVPTCALVLTCCSSGNPGLSGPDTGLGTAGAGASGSSHQGGSSNTNGGSTPDISLGGGDAAHAGSAGTATVDTSGCGDGLLQAAALGEVCDDGNNASGDGCAADCMAVEANFACLRPGKPCESTVACGDEKVSGAETCDDGNMSSLDGCSDACELEAGWICPTPGDACQAAKCGDGIVAGVEQCEDGNATPTSNDGCSAACALEPGYVCETPGSACRKAVCGDGVAEGGEPCDDKNQVVGDGCSPACEAEPVCDKPSDADGCSSRCGDGMLLKGDAEECDDGNKRDGDGCSATCQVEAGYQCVQQAGALPASITIPFTFRDFIALPSASTTKQRHPDFQARCADLHGGIVNATLDAEGKPVNSGACNLNADCTLQLGPITLGGDNCKANESCPNGFDSCDELHANHPLPGHAGKDPFEFWYRDTSDVNKSKVVPTVLTLTAGAYRFESAALYPFDADGWVKAGDEVAASGHNYGFTSEVRRWFEFNGGELLTFTGDDDVWVFINGKLALDIGGVHAIEKRSIRLNANGTVDCKVGEPGVFDDLNNCEVASRDLGLLTGKVYEIALFHAERHTSESNFRLALTGFVDVKSKCTAVCGDGTQTPGEACDDGKDNDDSAYGGCTKLCKRGPRCGDGKLQEPQEACDDGHNLTPYSPDQKGCAPGCQLPAWCGDAQVDSLFGEACDDGKNEGTYGGCEADCTLAPRCGDNVIDDPQETCDDGNAVSGDGCSAKCSKEAPK